MYNPRYRGRSVRDADGVKSLLGHAAISLEKSSAMTTDRH
jgi:hypothetical protein